METIQSRFSNIAKLKLQFGHDREVVETMKDAYEPGKYAQAANPAASATSPSFRWVGQGVMTPWEAAFANIQHLPPSLVMAVNDAVKVQDAAARDAHFAKNPMVNKTNPNNRR